MYSTHALLCSPGEMKSQRNPVFVLKKLLAPSATHMLCSTRPGGNKGGGCGCWGHPVREELEFCETDDEKEEPGPRGVKTHRAF